MKKNSFIILCLTTIISLSNFLHARGQTKADLFKQETPITWLGVDFSQVRYFGESMTVDQEEMKRLFIKINYLILAEPSKYNIKKTFRKTTVTANLDMVNERINKMDPGKIISLNYNEFYGLDTTRIKSLVSEFETGPVKGIALIIIMEGMNKNTEQASMWVTFFNADTKEVLLTQRLPGAAAGIGFRNHWAATIYSVFKKVFTSEYKRWEKAIASEK